MRCPGSFIVGDLRRTIRGKLQEDKLESAIMLRPDLRRNIGKHFTGRCRVTTDAVDAVFSDLDTGSRQLDQALQKLSNGSVRAGGSPQSLPFLVSFPVISVVEVIQSEKIVAVFRPRCGREHFGGW